jgi:hypothetical protein
MRILILNADYPGFLRAFYGAAPDLAKATYASQMAARNASLFGVADFYSRNLRAHGHEAAEIHVNNRFMQEAWAREHGMAPAEEPASPARAGRSDGALDRAKAAVKPLIKPFAKWWRRPLLSQRERQILRAQIEEFRPDLILNHDMDYVPSGFLAAVKEPRRLIVGQIAAALPEGESFAAYDLVISSLPNLVSWFRRRHVRAELNRLAFEPSILDQLGPPPERDIPLSFVGSLSPEHGGRIALLEKIAREAPLQVWGAGIERLPDSSPLHRCYRGQAWGRSMYEVLRRSRITLNSHIDLAEEWANNMRLYEATGAGAMLITDAKRNLHEIFLPGQEVVSYASTDECIARVRQYLDDEPGRSAIALAGQRRALEVHNYYIRMGEFLAIVKGFDAHSR